MIRPAVGLALVTAFALTLGSAPGAWAFRGWRQTGLSASAPGSTGFLGLIRKTGRGLESFAAVGAGDSPHGFSPWLGTGVHWEPATGLKISLEGRALLPDPSVGTNTASGLLGALTIDVTGW